LSGTRLEPDRAGIRATIVDFSSDIQFFILFF